MALRHKESLRGLFNIELLIKSCVYVEFSGCDHGNGVRPRSHCHLAARARLTPRYILEPRKENVSFAQTSPFSREYQNQAIPADSLSGSATSKPLADRDILRHLLGYVWPHDNPEFRWRVSGALALLFGSKLLNIQVRKFVFKYKGAADDADASDSHQLIIRLSCLISSFYCSCTNRLQSCAPTILSIKPAPVQQACSILFCSKSPSARPGSEHSQIHST
jgi:hypothetical protein